MIVAGVCGCNNNDEDPNAFLNAPSVDKKISKEQAGMDRGMSADEMKAMDEPARGKR